VSVDIGSALAAAERALAAVPDDPVRARNEAILVLGDRRLDPEAATIAMRTVGLVDRDTGRLSDARRRFRRAIDIAERAGLPYRAAQARTSLALVLLQTGDPEAALAELDLAAAQAPRQVRGAVLQQRALVLVRIGRLDEALEASRVALSYARREGDRLTEARALTNRGVLHAYRGQLGLAGADLTKALALYRELDSEFAAAQVLHNLGYVAGLAGDVPLALRRYDGAAQAFREMDVPLPQLHVDRAELLLSVRLLPEARREAERGVEGLEGEKNAIDLAEARLLLAQVALAEGALDVAASEARKATRELVRQRRKRWASQSRFVEAQARWAAGAAPRNVPEEASVLAVELESEGWFLPSLECRVIGARAAMRTGQIDEAKLLLDGVDPRARNGPAAQRVRVWFAEALSRLAGGNRQGAFAALRAGLDVAEQYRATLGSTELRVRTATAVSELAELGLELAFESRRAAEVLKWSERWRAGALRAPRATPPTDSRLAALLVSLRDAVGRVERASLEGDDPRPLVDRQRRIETEIRQRSRTVEGDLTAAATLASPAELKAVIGDRALVEFVEHAGQLHAVVGTRRGFHLCLIGDAAEIARDRASLQFALSKLALRRSARPSLDAAAALLERACLRLGEQLVRPLERYIGDLDLIVVPTGELHALPWALLPALRGRATTVSPSASLWLSLQARRPRARRSGATRGGVVLVAGPGVACARSEIEQLRDGFYEFADVLEGSRATASDVARAFEGRRLAHVAAHGTFRADNAQFSSLELADGPLTVYDLERIARPPEWMILSACDAGRSEVHPGNELMGTSAALLSLGTKAIVSSVAPVPDVGATPVMLSLHSRLAKGDGLAAALAGAQAHAWPGSLEAGDLAAGDEAALTALAAGVFVCLGAG
jgi:hypothetical protein